MMFSNNSHKGCITFNLMPIKNPWGGGNQWLLGFVSYLKGHGYLVNYKLGKKTDCVVIINSKGFS